MSGGIRAIVEINQTAANFKSSIVLWMDETKCIDVKSILGLSYSLYQDKVYLLEIHGPDETEAKAAMAEVFNKHQLKVEIKKLP